MEEATAPATLKRGDWVRYTHPRARADDFGCVIRNDDGMIAAYWIMSNDVQSAGIRFCARVGPKQSMLLSLAYPEALNQ